MKHLLVVLFVGCVAALAADESSPRTVGVEHCFKVQRLLKTDSSHYWADWTNTCPYTIDAIYVMVGFLDQSRKEMGNGVWPMYFVQPGAHRVTRFSAPASVEGFESVHIHRITTNSVEALAADQTAVEAVRLATVPPGTVGDTAVRRVIPYQDPNPASAETLATDAVITAANAPLMAKASTVNPRRAPVHPLIRSSIQAKGVPVTAKVKRSIKKPSKTY